MRYSFHGKVRANGQQVDGFVEAASATEAIDRLADRGIIGVYSVRPEPRPLKNAVTLAGEPEPEEPQRPKQPQQNRRLPQRPATIVPTRAAPALVKPVVAANPAVPPVAQVLSSLPAVPSTGMSAAAMAGTTMSAMAMPTTATPATAMPSTAEASVPATIPLGPELMLFQMLDRLTDLMGRVEQALSRPTVMYQAGPVRTSGFTPVKKSGRIPLDVQSSTLHDIFKNNLDLRKSLDKLAHTVGTVPARVVPVRELAARDGAARDGGFADGGTREGVNRDGVGRDGVGRDGVKSDGGTAPNLPLPAPSHVVSNVVTGPRELANMRDSVREGSKPTREPSVIAPKLSAQAQPA